MECEDCGRYWPEHELTEGLCPGCWEWAQEGERPVRRPANNQWCGECGCVTNHTSHPDDGAEGADADFRYKYAIENPEDPRDDPEYPDV